MKNPCRNCLVKPTCSKICREKLLYDKQDDPGFHPKLTCKDCLETLILLSDKYPDCEICKNELLRFGNQIIKF